MKSSAGRRFVAFLWLVSFLVLGPQGDARDDAFEKVIRAIKGVAWAALSTGVEEAATRLLGPTAWRIVKRIGEPALKELLPTGDKPPREVVTRVIYSLDSDAVLRQEVRQRFEALPRGERDSLLGKIEQIEDHLFRIERLAIDTNLTVKELKQLLLSVLRTPALARTSLPGLPEGLRRFDAGDSLLSIVYPRDLEPPRKHEQDWLVGARMEQGWKGMMDYKQPNMLIQVLGVPQRPSASANKKLTLDAVRQILTEQGCATDNQKFPVQELSPQVGMLFVGMCDRTWPAPNTYVAVRLFYSNGANVYIRAMAVGDDMWKKYESPLLRAMRLTGLRGVCGFYGTACCTPTGSYACEPGLRCQKEMCLPRSSSE